MFTIPNLIRNDNAFTICIVNYTRFSPSQTYRLDRFHASPFHKQMTRDPEFRHHQGQSPFRPGRHSVSISAAQTRGQGPVRSSVEPVSPSLPRYSRPATGSEGLSVWSHRSDNQLAPCLHCGIGAERWPFLFRFSFSTSGDGRDRGNLWLQRKCNSADRSILSSCLTRLHAAVVIRDLFWDTKKAF